MFEIKYVDYKDRSGNLKVSASGVVKSNKFFPTYIIDGENYIFKPLSKTKPLTTGLFSIAEVYWSNIINKYFQKVPIYELSICNGYEESEPKYYNYGCLVPNVLRNNEYTVNLLEYFREHKDSRVNIDNYINYCMLNYDYTNILSADIFKNTMLGEQLSYNVLLSILKSDQNYHYENVAFIYNNNKIKCLMPMIDHEFSTPFLFPDDSVWTLYYAEKYIKDLMSAESVIGYNVGFIKINYPNMVLLFLSSLNRYIEFLNDAECKNNLFAEIKHSEFLFDCNSDSYKIGIERYKNNNEKKARALENEIQLANIKGKISFIWDLIWVLNLKIATILKYVLEK